MKQQPHPILYLLAAAAPKNWFDPASVAALSLRKNSDSSLTSLSLSSGSIRLVSRRQVAAVTTSAAALLVTTASAAASSSAVDTATRSTDKEAAWLGPNLQPATAERPAIPLPSSSSSSNIYSKSKLPWIQGLIYGPSIADLALFKTLSAELRVDIVDPFTSPPTVTDSNNNSNDSNDNSNSISNKNNNDDGEAETILQSARIPMTQITSFPFNFQFSKSSTFQKIKNNNKTNGNDGNGDLIVRAFIVDDSNSNNASNLCALWQGQGLAKALDLSTTNGVAVDNNNKNEKRPKTVADTIIRLPASVRLLKSSNNSSSNDSFLPFCQP